MEENSLSACNLFLKNGIEQEKICFLTKEDGQRFIGGMPVLKMDNLQKRSEKKVFVDCIGKYSAWGPSELDYFDYIGYERNEKYFCIKDYIDLPDSDFRYLLRGKDLVLVGDVLLCKKFY